MKLPATFCTATAAFAPGIAGLFRRVRAEMTAKNRTAAALQRMGCGRRIVYECRTCAAAPAGAVIRVKIPSGLRGAR